MCCSWIEDGYKIKCLVIVKVSDMKSSSKTKLFIIQTDINGKITFSGYRPGSDVSSVHDSVGTAYLPFIF